MQSFGIPSNQMPLVNGIVSNKKRRKRNKVKKKGSAVGDDDTNGNIKLKNHSQWLQLCQLKERNMQLYGKEWKHYVGHQIVIECPNHTDVLSGRGKDIMNHPGNLLLRSIVASKVDEYIKAESHFETTKLTFDVVHLLKNEYGARFLKEETIETNGKLGCWIEIPDEAARIKVRVSFRDKSKQQQEQQQQQQQHNKSITTPKATTTMITSTADNNYTIPNNSNNNQHMQQYHHVDEVVSDSSTSMFLNMAGGNNSSGSGCGGTITGKKNKLQKKSYFSHFDCMS